MTNIFRRLLSLFGVNFSRYQPGDDPLVQRFDRINERTAMLEHRQWRAGQLFVRDK